MTLQAVSDGGSRPLPYSAATLQHIGLLRRKQERLLETQIAAEEQFLHSVAAAHAAGELDTHGLAEAYQEYRLAAAAGFQKRWDAAIPVSAATLREWPSAVPNGPSGSWEGTYPINGGPAPRPGVCVVYVLFDLANQPCYVGSTSGFRVRLGDHRRDGKSFVRWTAFPCTDREAAYQLEDRLLAEHQPYLNKKRGR